VTAFLLLDMLIEGRSNKERYNLIGATIEEVLE
jgi:hypothetical protein